MPARSLPDIELRSDHDILVRICGELQHMNERLDALDERLDDLPARVRALEERAASSKGRLLSIGKGLWGAALVLLGVVAKSLFP